MAKLKYFIIPKKPFNPRIVHLYDIAAMVCAFVLALTVMPLGHTLDLSVGFNEKSEAYLQAEHQDLIAVFEEGTMSSRLFQELFETSCLQNGGYVYHTRDGYYYYQDGDQGLGYYKPDDEGNLFRADQQEGDNPRGLIADGVCLSVMENGQIFMDDLNGKSGLTDAYVDLDAELDYAEVANIMLSDEISYRDAAMLWYLIQQETIVGFDGNAVWFQEPGDGFHQLYRATTQGVEEMGTLEGELWDVMVIDDRYMIYAKDGNLHIYSLETEEGTYMPFDEWTDLGELKQLAYRLRSDGKIRVYTLNSVTPTYYDLSGNGVEMDQMIKMSQINAENYSGLYITRTGGTTFVWFKEPGQYVHIKQD